MATKGMTRRELLDRWRGIEEEDDDDDNANVASASHSRPRPSLHHLKEEWFSDAFNFLICLPKENHIWCNSWDLMGPLLETFYNYFRDDRHDSPLKLLWKRISEEMRRCTQCICQHHQAQETYILEYELSSVSPLLIVLQSLDEERVTQHLKDINSRIGQGEYDPVRDNAEVVSVMFEVLMFPVLLDDQSLVNEFHIFIEAIDNSHELALEGHQQYPGVYALLFLKSRRVRSIGLRLAGNMGKLRRAIDLEPLQPFLKKCIGFLETEVLPSIVETSRPRVQLERTTLWLGIKALLGFLEPPAFEEGILERYPVFLSIVLNHISDDSVEFSYAVNCLRLLFEMLGCKLWLRAALSPSVMRNTLLALQDGEHEKQRRHFLYFLLHQVTVSSNFSTLMKKKACQIALLIVHRGYKMIPPSPPFECAHMWGPTLVSSLKDSSLHSSLRQPAFDLIQTIIVSDAAALMTSVLNCRTSISIGKSMSSELCDENEDEDEDEDLLFVNDAEEKGGNCWNEFTLQGKVTSREFGEWMCIPMLWFDVLVEMDPLVLPISFSKAVLWALSRLSLVEPENSTELSIPVRSWLSTCASEILYLIGWKVPSGFDDDGSRKESTNSIKVSSMCLPLIKTFKRLTAHFVLIMEHGELQKQWTWEPRMSESLILTLVDPNDNARQAGRRILEQISNTRGLACGLQFLCSCSSSLSAVLFGLRLALKLVPMNLVLLNFQSLHHFFFVIFKLLKEGVKSTLTVTENSSDDPSTSKFSLRGGFLWEPVFHSVPNNVDVHSANVNLPSWEKFGFLLAGITWPFIQKCLEEGKTFVDSKISQMTCVRLLEILPVVYERLCPPFDKLSGRSSRMLDKFIDYKWLNDLMDWGRSSLPVILRYWKQTVVSLLGLLKRSCSDMSTSVIRAIEKLMSCETVAMDELIEQVSHLSVSLSDGGSYVIKENKLTLGSLASEDLFRKKFSEHDGKLSSLENADVQILATLSSAKKSNNDTVIVLSDDEIPLEDSANKANLSKVRASQCVLDDNNQTAGAAVEVSWGDLAKMNVFTNDTSENSIGGIQQDNALSDLGFVHQKSDSNMLKGREDPADLVISKDIDSKMKETKSKPSENDSFSLRCKPNLKSSSSVMVGSKSLNEQSFNKGSETSDTVIKELVCDTEDDPWEFAARSSGRQKSYTIKSSSSVPKRQVIQLNLHVENRSGHLHRLEKGIKRFKPPRLDEWYRPILEIDYFATVGLVSANGKDDQTVSKLKEVPLSFHSPEQYVEIFRPLVLEEFKAQLRSTFMETSSEEMSCGSLSVLSVERIDDFHIVRCVHDDGDPAGRRSCSENDLILLTRQPLQNSSHEVHIVGKVERREKVDKRRSSILVIRFYLQNGSSRMNRARKFLTERSKWYISRIMSITPQLREFHALSSIYNIPLLPVILNPVNHPFGHYGSRKEDLRKLPQPLFHILKSSYNDNQLQAIGAAIGPPDSKGGYEMSLIQGPPGTGKTRTILAIVSGLFAFSSQKSDIKKQLNGSLKRSDTLFSSSKPCFSQSALIARSWQDAALARQLNDDVEKSCKSMGSCTRGRVLICAQSNAAVDELVSRISSEGIYGSEGAKYKPYLVRVGNVKSVHANSLPFFIDTLVDQKLAVERLNAGDGKNDTGIDTLMSLRASLEKLVDRIRFYEAKRANLRDRDANLKSLLEGEASKVDDGKELSDAEIGAKLRKLYEQKKAIYKDLSIAQARERKENEESKAQRQKLRRSILREAEIVVSTLSGCGGDLYGVCSESLSSRKFSTLSEHALFDAIVIDEAAQALEPATLIPFQLLKSGGAKCIMVGDPKQLPATVLSNIASKYLYQCSMFERLQKAGHPVIMLTMQYRMHPEICHFPSVHFYDKKLLNGDQMCAKLVPFHETEGLGPYLFFDIVDGHELHGSNSGGLSLYNECEADAAVEILRFFKKRYPSEFVGGRIGIITPYKCQLSLLRSRFSSAFGSSISAEMEFNTVDGFQGREVDILVLSTVRAAGTFSAPTKINSSSIGFVADVRRMNVALTRARLSLWILGNAKTLQTNHNWAALVRDAKERNLVISVKKPYESMFQSGFKKDPVIENSDNCSKERKGSGKVKNATWHAEQKQNHSGKSHKSEKGHITSKSCQDKATKVEEYNSTRENVKTSKRVRNEHDLSVKKDHKAAALASSECRTSKYMQSFVTGRQGDESRGRHKKEIETAVLLAEGSIQERGMNDRGKALNKVDMPKDANMKRRQQRDAVDALLSSALISSKRTEISSKSLPVRRSVSPNSTTGRGIKPSKLRKV
ncbi:uncharacterized protein LOC127794403 isoform X2 [Diospyros lotus]|uniref:uncharacterized protein LOC127794403 isoform X2 n=1 Tax=Diospyros lotus TaxID=55363 RepID=UPI0022537723|nr:uncharacterized protein LOC127794403 isoform X2 [Diospyros lotus]